MTNISQALAEDIREGIAKAQKTGALGAGADKVAVVVRHAENPEHGDYASPVAMPLGKMLRKAPLDMAGIIAEHMPKKAYVGKLEAVAPGFLNIRLNPGWMAAQIMRFVSGGKPIKLSKRKGQIVTPKDLIDEVGYDASRFFMVQHALTTHMDFDLDLARERSERNPVYYVQYAYVRLQSILRRAKEEGAIDAVGETVTLSSRAALTHTVELELMRHLYRFPEIVTEIATTFEVQGLTYYARDIAKAIHVFYKHVPVLAADDLMLVAARLQLVLATRKVLGEVLDMLGIGKPDVM